MPLDPQMKAMVDQMVAAGQPPVFAEIGAEAAKAVSDQSALMMGTGPTMAREEEFTVDGADGHRMRARLYVAGERASALLVFFHGGGWVVGSIEGYDPALRRFARASGCAILSVDYRLAPEFRFPTAPQDCYAALCWAAAHRSELGLPADLPLVVGGDSAGGNLTAVVSLMARDRGEPALAAQLLIYPATDCDFETPSYREFTTNLPLTSSTMQWFWEQYEPDPARRRHPHASPLRADDHAGLPPALLILAGYDPLLSDGQAYGRTLEAAGNRVTTLIWDGLTHGFFQFAEVLEPAGQANDEIAAALTGMLGVGS